MIVSKGHAICYPVCPETDFPKIKAKISQNTNNLYLVDII